MSEETISALRDGIPDAEERPTLHEIAAMSFPASQEAMRKYYDKNWHRDLPEADEDGKRRFRVRFDWTLEGSFDEEVEAEDEAEAEEIAREMVSDDYFSGYLDVSYLKVTPADPKDVAAMAAYTQAIEARRAATLGAVHESAVPEGNAP